MVSHIGEGAKLAWTPSNGLETPCRPTISSTSTCSSSSTSSTTSAAASSIFDIESPAPELPQSPITPPAIKVAKAALVGGVLPPISLPVVSPPDVPPLASPAASLPTASPPSDFFASTQQSHFNSQSGIFAFPPKSLPGRQAVRKRPPYSRKAIISDGSPKPKQTKKACSSIIPEENRPKALNRETSPEISANPSSSSRSSPLTSQLPEGIKDVQQDSKEPKKLEIVTISGDIGSLSTDSENITSEECNEEGLTETSGSAESSVVDDDPLVFETYDEKAKGDKSIVNWKIYNCLKEKVKGDISLGKDPGMVYVFESPARAENHVKIGKTKRISSKRKGELEKCKFELFEVEDTYRKRYHHYGIVEQLIHAEFHLQRKKLGCTKCKPRGDYKNHTEWFEIDGMTAQSANQRWRDWIIIHKPFDDDGNLTPYWRWRVDKLAETKDEIKWNEWRQPGKLDYYKYKIVTLRKYEQPLQEHFSSTRKDSHFCAVGAIIVLLLFINFGEMGGILAFIALLAL